PGHPLPVETTCHPDRLFPGVGAVGVGEKLHALSDASPRLGHTFQVAALPRPPLLPDLDPHPRDPLLLDPPAELGVLTCRTVGGEPTAAVDGNLRPGRPEHL